MVRGTQGEPHPPSSGSFSASSLVSTAGHQEARSSDFYRESVDISLAMLGAGVLLMDAQGCITRMTPLAEHVTGWREPEAIGRSFWDVWRRENQPTGYESANVVDLVLAQGWTAEKVHRVVVISTAHQHTPVEVKTTVIYTPDGRPSGLIVAFWDITRLAAAEIESRRLAAIVESSNDAIIGKTLEGVITDWNRAAERLFGYTASEMVGRTLRHLIPLDRQSEEDFILDQIAKGRKVGAFETVRVRKDGGLVDVSVSISPIINADGRIVGASKIARDISVQKHEEHLRLATVRLEAENRQAHEANRLKTQFLSNVSHELRTPLNGIIGFATLLKMEHAQFNAEDRKRMLNQVQASGHHLLRLVNDLLDIAKIEAGHVDLQPEDIDVKATVESVIGQLSPQFDARHLQSVVACEAAVQTVHVDPDRGRPDRHRRAPAHERQGGDGLRGALRRGDALRQGLQGGDAAQLPPGGRLHREPQDQEQPPGARHGQGHALRPRGAGGRLAERRGRRAVPPGRGRACACRGPSTSTTACC
jgi:PAS domain S-box-containing protein